MDKWDLMCSRQLAKVNVIKNKLERQKQWALYLEMVIMIYGSHGF
jgi:hypothetical protein